MKLTSLVAGLDILKEYFEDPDGYHVNAEHDEIFVTATDMPVPRDDVEKLLGLGWFQENADDYDPEADWKIYT